MERLKAYSHYIILLLLQGGAYKMWHVTPEKFLALKTIGYNGHKYRIDHNQVSYLHGWCPWKSYNPWNPWSMCYLYIYQWYHATGLLVFKEPADPLHAVEVPEPPLKFLDQSDEKWTPAVVAGVALSKLYKDYDKKLSYGGFKLTPTLLIILLVAVIFLLLLATGRINF